MKRLILLFALLTSLCVQSFGQTQPSIEPDTTSGTTVVSTIDDADDYWIEEKHPNGGEIMFGTFEKMVKSALIIPIISIIMGISLPILIVFFVLYFRHKNKQAKYKLASEALAAGKDVPKDLFKEDFSSPAQNNETLTKGIKDICLGIGLAVFLWLLTDVEAIAAIGFLIFCMGVGKVIIAYATRTPNNDNKSNNFPEEQK